jgi:hypothetical protein
MTTQISRRTKLSLVATTLVCFLGASVAFAQWTATGAGTGFAKAATVEALSTQSATASGDLYPGGSGDLNLMVHNPNPFPVTLSSVTPNGGVTSDSAACDQAGNGVSFGGVSGLAVSVAAASDTPVTLAHAVTMRSDAPDACQGATFRIPVSLNGGSAPVTTTTAAAPTTTTTQPTTYTYYVDNDGDRFGNPSATTRSASPTAPAGFTTNGDDCNDSNATINPAAQEVAGNGVDDNCDGIVS